jgi:hypothetical protein
MHEQRADPALTVEDQWQRRDEWEDNARRALQVAFTALYPPPKDMSE